MATVEVKSLNSPDENGGGWGPPLERPVEAVLDDVRDGYVTLEQAEREYGVVVDPETFEVVRLTREKEALT